MGIQIPLISKNCRKSASLIFLARLGTYANNPGTFNYKVLLFQRSAESTFMPNSSVFPGGVSEKEDEVKYWQEHFDKFGLHRKQLKEMLVPSLESSHTIFGNKKQFLKDDDQILERQFLLRITAIRETFEEVGIMLCRSEDCLVRHIYGLFKDNFDRKYWQELVHNDASKFLKLCEHLNVIPDIGSLNEWSNWVTPATFQKRFNTAFYVVALKEMPENLVIDTEHEVQDYKWLYPMEHLKMFSLGECWLPPPQIYELSRLSNFTELSELIKFAQICSTEGILVHLPVQYKCSNRGTISVLPGDDLYPENPDSCNELMNTGKSIEELRTESEHLHRLEFYGLHDVNINIRNVESFGKHIHPICYKKTMQN